MLKIVLIRNIKLAVSKDTKFRLFYLGLINYVSNCCTNCAEYNNIHIFQKINISKQSNGGVNQHKMDSPADLILTGGGKWESLFISRILYKDRTFQIELRWI